MKLLGSIDMPPTIKPLASIPGKKEPGWTAKSSMMRVWLAALLAILILLLPVFAAAKGTTGNPPSPKIINFTHVEIESTKNKGAFDQIYIFFNPKTLRDLDNIEMLLAPELSSKFFFLYYVNGEPVPNIKAKKKAKALANFINSQTGKKCKNEGLVKLVKLIQTPKNVGVLAKFRKILLAGKPDKTICGVKFLEDMEVTAYLKLYCKDAVNPKAFPQSYEAYIIRQIAKYSTSQRAILFHYFYDPNPDPTIDTEADKDEQKNEWNRRFSLLEQEVKRLEQEAGLRKNWAGLLRQTEVQFFLVGTVVIILLFLFVLIRQNRAKKRFSKQLYGSGGHAGGSQVKPEQSESQLAEFRRMKGRLAELEALEKRLPDAKKMEAWLKQLKTLKNQLPHTAQIYSLLAQLKGLDNRLPKLEEMDRWLREIKEPDDRVPKLEEIDSRLKQLKSMEHLQTKAEGLRQELEELQKMQAGHDGLKDAKVSLEEHVETLAGDLFQTQTQVNQLESQNKELNVQQRKQDKRFEQVESGFKSLWERSVLKDAPEGSEELNVVQLSKTIQDQSPAEADFQGAIYKLQALFKECHKISSQTDSGDKAKVEMLSLEKIQARLEQASRYLDPGKLHNDIHDITKSAFTNYAPADKPRLAIGTILCREEMWEMCSLILRARAFGQAYLRDEVQNDNIFSLLSQIGYAGDLLEEMLKKYKIVPHRIKLLKTQAHDLKVFGHGNGTTSPQFKQHPDELREVINKWGNIGEPSDLIYDVEKWGRSTGPSGGLTSMIYYLDQGRREMLEEDLASPEP